MKRIYKYAKGYYKYVFLSPLFVIMEAVLEVLIPLVNKNLIDVGIKNQDLKYIFVAASIILGMSILSLIGGVGSGFFATKASAGLGHNIRKELYKKVQTFSFANIDKFQTASLITRLTTDVNNVQQSFQMTIRICFRAPILFLAALITSCVQRWELGLIFLFIIPVLLLAVIVVMFFANRYFKQMFKQIDKLNLVVQENINGIRTVKSFTNEDEETTKENLASERVKYFATKGEALGALFSPISQFLMYTSTTLIVFISVQLMVGDDPSMLPGELQLFINYGIQILSSLMMVCGVMMMLIISHQSVIRILEVLDETPDIKDPLDPVKEVKSGSVEFRDVNFSYSKDMDKLALKDVSFRVESGQTIGIFGATGSSKTTLISLIDRLYDTTSGAVLVGDVDVKNYSLFSLREAVSVVLQKNTLFSGTIKSNMLWGNENATDEEIKQALDDAQASEFVFKLQDGINSKVEEGGVNFSGGQKQRLCIARALVKKPKILILDDSTSAVDTKTDSLIRDAFKNHIPNTTKFIISQRISSIKDADKIIILDDGKLIAFGNHDELMNNDDYRRIYLAQIKASPKGGAN